MMNSTQAVFSVALTSLAMGTADPVLLGTAAISSQFPDLDTSKSWIGRLPPLSLVARWIEKRYSHRTLTHSFLFSLGLAAVTFPVTLWNQSFWIALIWAISWAGMPIISQSKAFVPFSRIREGW